MLIKNLQTTEENVSSQWLHIWGKEHTVQVNNPTTRHLFKRNEIGVPKWCLNLHVHCSISHSSQDKESS